MSRSRQRTPITGNTKASSEKENKRMANRLFRRKTKIQLKTGDTPFVSIKAVSNVWVFNKDGKHYLRNATSRDMRK